MEVVPLLGYPRPVSFAKMASGNYCVDDWQNVDNVPACRRPMEHVQSCTTTERLLIGKGTSAFQGIL